MKKPAAAGDFQIGDNKTFRSKDLLTQSHRGSGSARPQVWSPREAGGKPRQAAQGAYCFTASTCNTRRTLFGKPQSTP